MSRALMTRRRSLPYETMKYTSGTVAVAQCEFPVQQHFWMRQPRQVPVPSVQDDCFAEAGVGKGILSPPAQRCHLPMCAPVNVLQK